jgi:hypothetical protein
MDIRLEALDENAISLRDELLRCRKRFDGLVWGKDECFLVELLLQCTRVEAFSTGGKQIVLLHGSMVYDYLLNSETKTEFDGRVVLYVTFRDKRTEELDGMAASRVDRVQLISLQFQTVYFIKDSVHALATSEQFPCDFLSVQKQICQWAESVIFDKRAEAIFFYTRNSTEYTPLGLRHATPSPH